MVLAQRRGRPRVEPRGAATVLDEVGRALFEAAGPDERDDTIDAYDSEKLIVAVAEQFDAEDRGSSWVSPLAGAGERVSWPYFRLELAAVVASAEVGVTEAAERLVCIAGYIWGVGADVVLGPGRVAYPVEDPYGLDGWGDHPSTPRLGAEARERRLRQRDEAMRQRTAVPRPLLLDCKDTSAVTIRFLHVNDVYQLETFPSFKTLLRELGGPGAGADRVVVTMGGDFLAPYLLSGLDHGAGMVDCMNELGVTHCCFGNHECDVPHGALLKAIDDFRGVWINSNMKGGGFGEHPKLPTVDTIEATSPDKSQHRRVNMLGLLTNSPVLYREGVFNGAASSIEEVNSCCKRLCASFSNAGAKNACDIVVPMTHQDCPLDDVLSRSGREMRVPLILGGHDHTEVWRNSPDAAAVVKAGMDALKVGLVDVTWPTTRCDWPTVSGRLLTTSDFPPDPDMQRVVERHMTKVWALDHMVLCQRQDMEKLVKPGTPFPITSKGTRVGESSMATLLCTALGRALGAEVCVLEGGAVRAAQDYDDQFTASDLGDEMPFANQTVVAQMPGAVLVAAIVFSRAKAQPGKPYAFFLHCDNAVHIDPSTHEVHTLAGEPVDPERIYSVAIACDLGIGSGVNEPLMEWARTHAVPDKELGIQARTAIQPYFCRRLWSKLPSFDEMDTAKDGYLPYEDVHSAYMKVFMPEGSSSRAGASEAASQMVWHLIRSLDRAGDDRVSREEYSRVLVDV